MRWVLDTNVIVAGFRSPRGASAQLIAAALDGRFTLLATPTLFLEYESVLTRPAHLAAAGATVKDVHRLVANIVDVLDPVDVHVRYRPLLTDPDDEFVLECAINGNADAIVTSETRTFAPAIGLFGLVVMTPQSAWRMLRR